VASFFSPQCADIRVADGGWGKCPGGRLVVGWGGIALPNEPGSVFTNIGAGWNHGMAVRNDGKL